MTFSFGLLERGGCPRYDVLVWSNGRLIARYADEFVQFVLENYGLRIDLNAEEILAYTAANKQDLINE